MSAKRFLKLFTISLTIAVFTILTVTAIASAADRFWVGGTGSWSDNGTHWSASSGGAPGASLPTSSDDVYFDANSFTGAGQVVTVDNTAYCASMNWTGVTNNPTLTFTYSISNYGNVVFSNSMTTSGNSVLSFKSTGNLTTNGLTINNKIYANDASSVLGLLDDVTCTNYILITQGTFNTNNNKFSCTTFGDGTSSSAKTINLGSSEITCVTLSWSKSGATINANTSTITVTGDFDNYDYDWNGASFVFTGTSPNIDGSLTCANLTRTGTATKTDDLTLEAGETITVEANCVLDGNSATNRLLVKTDTLGSVANITVGAGNFTVSNVDFMDIAATNAVDLSAITGGSGDCGGNSGITFTTVTTQTWAGGTGSWDDVGQWTSHVPYPQDTVIVDTTGGTVTVNMPRIGGNVTINGTGDVAPSNGFSVYGTLHLSENIGTLSIGNHLIYLRGRGNHELHLGKRIKSFQMYAYSGNYTLTYNVEGTVNNDSANIIRFYAGTFDTDGYDMLVNSIYAYSTYPVTIYLRDSTITLSSTSNSYNVWNLGSGATFDAGTSTIVITSTSTPTLVFTGNKRTYNDIQVVGLGNYVLTISSSNTFNDIYIDASSAAKTIKFTDGTTQIVNDITRDCLGTNVITFNGTAAAGWALNITNANPIWLDYLAVEYGTANTTIYAGDNSVDGGSNTGWSFVDPNLTVTNTGASGLSMDKDGVISGNFTANITPLAGTPYITACVNYAENLTLSSNTTPADICTYNQFNGTIPVGLTPGQTYYWTGNATNGAGTFNGTVANFTLTQPSGTIGSMTGRSADTSGNSRATITGSISDMGVASDCYTFFEWDYDGSAPFDESTADRTVNTTGTVSAVIEDFDIRRDVYFRMGIKNGSVTTYTSVTSFDGISGGVGTGAAILIFVIAVLGIGGIGLAGSKKKNNTANGGY